MTVAASTHKNELKQALRAAGIFAFLLAVGAGIFAAAQSRELTPFEQELHARAERIFHYDASGQNTERKLTFNQLATLSVSRESKTRAKD